jgi:hypothetical protein
MRKDTWLVFLETSTVAREKIQDVKESTKSCLLKHIQL